MCHWQRGDSIHVTTGRELRQLPCEDYLRQRLHLLKPPTVQRQITGVIKTKPIDYRDFQALTLLAPEK